MEKQIKVLFVSTFDNWGGAAKATYRIHLGIQKLGVISHLFVKNKTTDDINVKSVSEFEPKDTFYRIYSFVLEKIKNKFYKSIWNKYPQRQNIFLSDLRSVSSYGALQKIEYDLLHLQWFNIRFLDIKDLLRVDKPIVWTLHDHWGLTGICHYFDTCDHYKEQCGKCQYLGSTLSDDLSYQIWNKKNDVFRNLNLYIVTPSIWLANSVRESSLLGKFPVSVIPNCLDTNIYTPVDKRESAIRLGLDPEIKRIVFGAVNSLSDKRKGFNKLLESLKYLETKYLSATMELVIFGTNDIIDTGDINMRVTSLGYITDEKKMVDIYNSADVVAVPSLMEVFGQTASEPMACGIPVVAFNCSGIKEVVDHKLSGYLATPFDIEDFGDGIIWCINSNVNGQLSLKARSKVLENYALDKVANKYKELYESILNV